MTSMRRLTYADVERVPWKNGRGETAQIALWPPTSTFARGDFDWRISRAAVTEPGPFSMFPGFDRVLVIIGGGEEIHLHHDGAAPPARVGAWQPYCFSGDWLTSATLPAGPVNDLNVLTRRDRVSARVRLIDIDIEIDTAAVAVAVAPITLAGEHVLVHVIAGHLEATVGASPTRTGLDPFDTLWLTDVPAGLPVSFHAVDAQAKLVVVELHPAADAPRPR